jgi:protein-tyrosine phosphatase
LDTIDAARNGGVYVHCWGGVGRTGTVVGCWLLRHGMATPDNVIETIRLLRRADPVRGHRPSPETPEQRRFILDWREA